MPVRKPRHASVQVVLNCRSLADSVRFLTSELGFEVRMIMPAEDPTVAVLSAPDCVLRLEQIGDGAEPPAPARLRILLRNRLGDKDSNLDSQIQSLASCR